MGVDLGELEETVAGPAYAEALGYRRFLDYWESEGRLVHCQPAFAPPSRNNLNVYYFVGTVVVSMSSDYAC